MSKITKSMRSNARVWADEALAILGYPRLKLHIEWNSRFTSKMGDATYYRPPGCPRIRLSEPMWPMRTEAERRDTVIHEVCHIVVRYEEATTLSKRSKHHGPEWKAKMRQCGLEPMRCHDFDVSKAPGSRRKKKLYCGCDSPHMVTANKHNKAASGASYRCKTCKQTCRIEPPQSAASEEIPETIEISKGSRLAAWLRESAKQ